MQTITARDVFEPIQRHVFREFGDDHLGKYARTGNTATHRTRGNLRSHDSITAAGASILGEHMDLELKAGGDELQHACLILADACLGFSAMRADLLGLGYVVLDADLR